MKGDIGEDEEEPSIRSRLARPLLGCLQGSQSKSANLDDIALLTFLSASSQSFNSRSVLIVRGPSSSASLLFELPIAIDPLNTAKLEIQRFMERQESTRLKAFEGELDAQPLLTR